MNSEIVEKITKMCEDYELKVAFGETAFESLEDVAANAELRKSDEAFLCALGEENIKYDLYLWIRVTGKYTGNDKYDRLIGEANKYSHNIKQRPKPFDLKEAIPTYVSLCEEFDKGVPDMFEYTGQWRRKYRCLPFGLDTDRRPELGDRWKVQLLKIENLRSMIQTKIGLENQVVAMDAVGLDGKKISEKLKHFNRLIDIAYSYHRNLQSRSGF